MSLGGMSDAQVATIGLIGLALAWLWLPFDELLPMHPLGYARLALVGLVTVGWVKVARSLAQPSADAVTQSLQRLQKAIATPGAQSAGITTEW